MLSELKILNGNLELEFNEYIYEYTVTVEEDVTSLEFSYTVLDGVSIEIENNILDDYENTVYIKVYTIDEEITYTFLVYKESSTSVSSIDAYLSSLELNTNDTVPVYELQLLAIGLFLAIVISFALIFKRK